jgi:hypothetical protein
VNPTTTDTIVTALQVIIPALAAFFVGHYQVIPSLLGTTKATAPVTPATPVPATTPAQLAIGQGGILQLLEQLTVSLRQSGIGGPASPANPVGPNFPAVPQAATIAPLGQGGLLQIVTMVLQGIMSHPTTTPQQKADAASAVVTATAPFITQTK